MRRARFARGALAMRSRGGIRCRVVGFQLYRTPLDSSLPETAHSASARPRVMAEATMDSEHFYILVGEGLPRFGVAVSGE